MSSFSEILEQLEIQRLFGDDLPRPVPYPREEALSSSQAPTDSTKQSAAKPAGKRINKKKQRRRERRAAEAKRQNRTRQAAERLGMEALQKKSRRVSQYSPVVDTREPIDPAEPQFLQAAKRSVDRENPPLPFVACPELQRDEPRYGALSREQREYYFSWRTSVRKGQFVATDAGYLQLHLHEIIHLIGFSHAREAFEHLYSLFENYTEHEFTRIFLPLFLVDMVLYYELPKNTMNLIYTMMSQRAIYISNSSLMLEAWLRKKDRSFEQLPLGLLISLAEYKDFNKGKFFEALHDIAEFRQGFMLQRIYQKATEGLENYYLKHEKMSFLASFQRYDEQDISRRPFNEQYFYYPTLYLTIASVPSLSYDEERDKLMESSLKYAENLFRKELKLRGSRQVKINKRLQGYIEKALEPLLEEARAYQRGQDVSKAKQAALEAKRKAEEERRNRPVRKVELDVGKLEQLEQESVHIRERLIQEEAAQQAEASKTQTTQVKATQTKATQTKATQTKVKTKETTPPEIKDRPAQDTPAMPREWLELHTALNENQQELLRLIQKRTSNKKLEAFAQKHFSMKDLLIEEVNELAMEWLEDNIIDPYQDPPVIYEEYHEQLEQLLKLT